MPVSIPHVLITTRNAWTDVYAEPARQGLESATNVPGVVGPVAGGWSDPPSVRMLLSVSESGVATGSRGGLLEAIPRTAHCIDRVSASVP